MESCRGNCRSSSTHSGTATSTSGPSMLTLVLYQLTNARVILLLSIAFSNTSIASLVPGRPPPCTCNCASPPPPSCALARRIRVFLSWCPGSRSHLWQVAAAPTPLQPSIHGQYAQSVVLMTGPHVSDLYSLSSPHATSCMTSANRNTNRPNSALPRASASSVVTLSRMSVPNRLARLHA